MLNISDNKIPDNVIRSVDYKSIEKAKSPKILTQFSKVLYTIIGIVFLMLFLPWTQNIRSNGVVTSFLPEDRPQTVNTVIPGKIQKWYVIEGQYVNKGDTIIHLSEVKDSYFNPELLKRSQEQLVAKEQALKATQDKAKALLNQIQALEQGQILSLEKAKNKLRQAELKLQSDSMDMIAAKLDQSIAKEQLDRQQVLYDKGLKSLTELEQRKIKYQETSAKAIAAENKFLAAKNELLNARIELNSIQAEYADKLAKAQSDYNSTLAYAFDTEGSIAKMKNDLANYTIRSGNYYITAPKSGYVIKALKAGIGEIIKEGEAVVTIVDKNSVNAVELYVKTMDVPLLHKGAKVRLQFDGWPALVFSGWPGSSFGTFGGIIQVVDYVSTNGGKYRILVTPDPDDIPWPEQLRIGGGVYGWALLNDVPIWYEIWRQLNGFPPDWLGENGEGAKDEKSIKEVDKKAEY
ncbi:MAG: HlyD family secretion protein [Bacteroidia bacterium]